MDVGAEVPGATALHGERDLFWGGLGDGVAEFILAGPTPGEYEDELVGEIDSFFEGGERRAFEVFFGFGGYAMAMFLKVEASAPESVTRLAKRSLAGPSWNAYVKPSAPG